ncbi:MAG TPA: sulfide/dihydroorotate dehydrogenase-like FAD/NAD-binding protein [Acidimicrobiia bacterium]|nr:sulfide/dihydroorotate dehydrogenase-like FAD/NAD-binding protein [Acidimicrobiia bacterium]
MVFLIRDADLLSPSVKRFWVEAPRVAQHWRPGQFVIVRVDGDGERIPLTIVDGDKDAGTICLIVQGIGATTMAINRLVVGDSLLDVAGPLGTPSRIEALGNVVVIGGGVGTAIAYPVARALHEAGNRVTAIIGGRSQEFVILEPELSKVCERVLPATDDGSYGQPGQVTDVLSELLRSGETIDHVFAMGPIPMMRAVAEVTRSRAIKTTVSLNPIMIDGTGMCGGCRVLVGSATKFVCIDGPEFDAHIVDFDVLTSRNRAYQGFELAQAQGCMSVSA